MSLRAVGGGLLFFWGDDGPDAAREAVQCLFQAILDWPRGSHRETDGSWETWGVLASGVLVAGSFCGLEALYAQMRLWSVETWMKPKGDLLRDWENHLRESR